MVEVVWTEPALADLEAIADHIALDNPQAARSLLQRVFGHVDHLIDHPELGAIAPDLAELGYRHMVEPPVRIFYRIDDQRVFIVYVMRGEQRLSPTFMWRGE